MTTRTAPAAYPRKANGPLLYVVVVLEIEEIFEVERFIPGIQDSLRAVGYPRGRKGNVIDLFLDDEKVEPKLTPQWAFVTLEERRGVQISGKRIAVEATECDSFRNFSEQVRNALDLVCPQFPGKLLVNRIGIRYINAIQSPPGVDLLAMIDPQLAGPSAELIPIKNPALSLSLQGETDYGQLIVNLFHAPPGTEASLPPELSTPLNIPDKIDLERAHLVLDIDHFDATQRGLEIADVMQRLTELHRIVDDVFHHVTTDQAQQSWVSS